jgi:hypothetical protein
MSALEKFLHGKPKKLPTLLKAGLAHVQFETIHPFLEGISNIAATTDYINCQSQ